MSHISLVLYRLGIEWNTKKHILTALSDFSVLKSIRSIFDCRRVSVNSFVKLFEFCRSEEQNLMFHHFLEQLYLTFVESYIDQEHILLEKVIF